MLLKFNGIRSKVAGTVADAMSALTDAPDWIILDLMLPDGDGYSVLKHIRDEGLSIKVAVVSGCGDDERIAKVKSLAPEAFFAKPLDHEKLFALIKS